MPVKPEHEVNEKFLDIFYPELKKRQKVILKENRRFVHYTSAESAKSILSQKKFWLRPTSCMNDFSEVEHGLHCIHSAYNNSGSGLSFRDAIEKVRPGIAAQVESQFNSIQNFVRYDSYIACFSEHDDLEDELGRLSMWRAYCGRSGVALILNSQGFFGDSDAFKSHMLPVSYRDDKDFLQFMYQVANNILGAANFLSQIPTNMLVSLIVNFLRFTAVTTKHPAFREEREWRVLHCPAVWPSPHLGLDVEVVNGIPQQVFKVPLVDNPTIGVTGIEIPKLIDRIIVGPTQFSIPICKALANLLQQAGDPNPIPKIVISNVPLRT